MGSRKKKKKRDRKKRARPPKPILPQHRLPEGTVIVETPAGTRKMSEVLLEFVEPYSDAWETDEELRKLLTLALVAWNAALMSGGVRDQFLQDMETAMPPEARPTMRAIVAGMIQRKLTHFASNTRSIIDFQVTPTPEGPHVSVASTLGSG